jgi:hypothetical protein
MMGKQHFRPAIGLLAAALLMIIVVLYCQTLYDKRPVFTFRHNLVLYPVSPFMDGEGNLVYADVERAVFLIYHPTEYSYDITARRRHSVVLTRVVRGKPHGEVEITLERGTLYHVTGNGSIHRYGLLTAPENVREVIVDNYRTGSPFSVLFVLRRSRMIIPAAG